MGLGQEPAARGPRGTTLQGPAGPQRPAHAGQNPSDNVAVVLSRSVLGGYTAAAS